jgi:enediyne biosynthesis protein E4
LGKNPQLEKVVIRWPSGNFQNLGKPVPGQLYKVKEPL